MGMCAARAPGKLPGRAGDGAWGRAPAAREARGGAARMSSVLQPGTLQLHMTVNGRPVDLEVGAGKSLLDVLRGELGLTGAKNGCDIGICGTCTVLVDGAVKKACVESAATMQGCSITTVEGIG